MRKKVKIGATTYKVKYVPGLLDPDDGKPLFGLTDTTYRMILINADMPLERQEQILFHECMHAALYETGQSQNINNEDLEEAICLAMESSLWPVFKYR